MRQDEFQRPDNVWRGGEHTFAFGQRLMDQTKFIELEVAQAAMDQFCRGRRRAACEIVLFDKTHGKSASGRIASDGAAIDAATDNQKIV